ncbi:hypothetical protein ACIOKD_35375 [Streptomyces sp. NPDC087844]|uniref:hypothetical protein n=1 Tax=Streptomyces sp. NPDC087844 TaxID=3365805 RepID=UPI0038288103
MDVGVDELVRVAGARWAIEEWFRLFSLTRQLLTTGRRRTLCLARHWPWTGQVTTAPKRLVLLPNPG